MPFDAAARARLRDLIAEKSLLKDGDFKLASGKSSSLFFDMKQTMFDPEGAGLIAEAVLESAKNLPGDYVGGLETGAIPVVAVVCERSHGRAAEGIRPLKGFFVRKQPKGTGTNVLIDGVFEPGATVIMVEDVTTTGGSSLKAADAAIEQGCKIGGVITLVDREEGAAANLAERGLTLTSVYTRKDFI